MKTSENDIEVRRLEILDREMGRLHEMLRDKGTDPDHRAWARDRIDEIQAVIIGSESLVVGTTEAYANNDYN